MKKLKAIFKILFCKNFYLIVSNKDMQFRQLTNSNDIFASKMIHKYWKYYYKHIYNDNVNE